MKGLLIKDYKLMLGQKSFLGMAALMAVLYLIIYKDPIVAVIFITVMCTMFTVSTLSYDEYENGMAYLFKINYICDRKMSIANMMISCNQPLLAICQPFITSV